ncbi:MAG: RNB domain-containing ribonuclease [Polyangia bacterium]
MTADSNASVLRRIAHRAMVTRGLEPDFPRAALDELAHLKEAPHDEVRDLTALLWCSIDNDESRDLDQLSVSITEGGTTRILVAIADVDALVKKGTALDAHAHANTTSVYTAAQIFPMLPERLSTDLTSLNADVVRLAMVIDMTVAADGTIGKESVVRARVRNKAKLAYDSVAAWLDGTGPMPHAVAAVPGMEEQLRVQDRIAQAMKARRHEHGALTLSTNESHVVFHGEALADLKPDLPNRAKQIIEDFMVGANGVVARFLEAHKFPSLRRVLKAPERWERIVALAAGRGEKLPATADAVALESFLSHSQQKDPTHFPDLSLSIVKLLGRGEYVFDAPGQSAPGHFGLAVLDYTHSTAPNRRYPDLITQRLVKAALVGNKVPYSTAELTELAQRCTTQEDAAAKVERQVRKSAAALLMHSRVGQTYDAIVTGASPKGTYVRLLSPAVEGRVMHGAAGLDVGDRTRVTLKATDVERGFIDFDRA